MEENGKKVNGLLIVCLVLLIILIIIFVIKITNKKDDIDNVKADETINETNNGENTIVDESDNPVEENEPVNEDKPDDDSSTEVNIDNSNKGIICRKLKALNYDDNFIAAIMINIEFESNYNPNVCGNDNNSYGLLQWYKVRFNNLIKYSGENKTLEEYQASYCDNNSYAFGNIDKQIDYLDFELNNNYQKVFNDLVSKTNASDKAYTFCYSYIVPANRNVTCQNRSQKVNELLEYVVNCS